MCTKKISNSRKSGAVPRLLRVVPLEGSVHRPKCPGLDELLLSSWLVYPQILPMFELMDTLMWLLMLLINLISKNHQDIVVLRIYIAEIP